MPAIFDAEWKRVDEDVRALFEAITESKGVAPGEARRTPGLGE